MSLLTQKIKNFLHPRKQNGPRSRGMRTPLRLERLEDRRLLAGDASGLLTGVAFVDFNTNGILDNQETVLPGVQTTLTGTTNQGVAVNVNATTTATGGFSFLNVQPG